MATGETVKPLLGRREGLEIAGAATLIGAALALDIAGMRAARGKHLLSAAAATATLVGGALLRRGMVFAGHRSAADRETMLRTMARPPERRGWGSGYRCRVQGTIERATLLLQAPPHH